MLELVLPGHDPASWAMVDVHDPAAPKTDASSASTPSVVLREAVRLKVSRTPEEVLTPCSTTSASVPPWTAMSADDSERLTGRGTERLEDDQ